MSCCLGIRLSSLAILTQYSGSSITNALSSSFMVLRTQLRTLDLWSRIVMRPFCAKKILKPSVFRTDCERVCSARTGLCRLNRASVPIKENTPVVLAHRFKHQDTEPRLVNGHRFEISVNNILVRCYRRIGPFQKLCHPEYIQSFRRNRLMHMLAAISAALAAKMEAFGLLDFSAFNFRYVHRRHLAA